MRDHQLLDRAAGAAVADRELRNAEPLDEVLPRHQRGFRGERVVACGLERVERVRRDCVALAEEADVDVADERRPLAVGRAAPTSEPEHEALVPSGCVPESTASVRVEDPDRVDAAIDDALLRPHDERDGITVDRRRREVGGARDRIVERLHGTVGRHIGVGDLARRVAVFVERRAETGFLGLAHPRLEVRTREDGPVLRMVRDDQRDALVACGRDDFVLAVLQAVDEPGPAVKGVDEVRTDVVAIARNGGFRHRRTRDRDQHVAGGDEPGSGRDRLEDEGTVGGFGASPRPFVDGVGRRLGGRLDRRRLGRFDGVVVIAAARRQDRDRQKHSECPPHFPPGTVFGVQRTLCDHSAPSRVRARHGRRHTRRRPRRRPG